MQSREEKFDLIQDRASFEKMVRSLTGCKQVAVDTESNSLYAYQEQVCLLQFSSRGRDYILDPLVITDLRNLAPFFADPKIKKIFHAAEYDLICLRRDFGFEMRNLFDTMIAARILGRSEIGLGALLEEEFGVKLEKRFQRANWGQRPLPKALLDYARLDTHYLIHLKERLESDLEAKGLLGLAAEDFLRLEKIHPENNNGHGEKLSECWRIGGAYDLSPRQAAVLMELCDFRDKAARQANQPLFKVISNQILLSIANEIPRNYEDLRKLPGLSPRQVNRFGERLLRAVENGLKRPEAHPPKTKRPAAAVSDRFDALRIWRKQTAEGMGVLSDVVLPKDLMLVLAQTAPRSRGELEAVLQDVPWRLERWGDAILKTLSTVNKQEQE